ncbi:hypothetical protein DLAC_07322 [Tieghemostelium lacteum]|uniref:EGF-like domain-containing protein n=1 Tax=Tieghemostelium lacteum TaxID=361077 RepID=A0A151ZCA0_TIELA|nr:hypothetical protein DLAC_07322 [Tieghemostelium lacteum]|eukprot:KYQ91555.1 hypothetical protein DLAC_07322 [Tieghemostelium lacteum]
MKSIISILIIYLFIFNVECGKSRDNYTACYVNQEFSACQENTCPTITGCIQLLQQQSLSTLNIYIYDGNYSSCPGTLSFSQSTLLNIQPYESGSNVNFDCSSQDGNFITIDQESFAVSLNISSVKIVNSIQGKLSCIQYLNPNMHLDAEISIYGGVFSNCKVVDGFGGAIYTSNVDVSVRNSNFQFNYADYLGGAVYVDNAKLFIFGSVFTNNTAVGGGAVGGTQVIAIQSLFTQNSANEGGAIYSSSVVVSNSIFNQNTAVGRGGAIATTGSLNATACNFNQNSASLGGQVNIDSQENIYILNSNFQGGSAINGAALNFDQNPYFATLSGSKFNNNVASEVGGGVFIYLTSTLFIGGVFINNPSSESPGDFPLSYINGVPNVQVASLTDCLSRAFIGNAPNYITGTCLNVNGTCVNGYAVVNSNGNVQQCNCISGWSGPTCELPVGSSSDSSSTGSSSDQSSSAGSSSDQSSSDQSSSVGSSSEQSSSEQSSAGSSSASESSASESSASESSASESSASESSASESSASESSASESSASESSASDSSASESSASESSASESSASESSASESSASESSASESSASESSASESSASESSASESSASESSASESSASESSASESSASESSASESSASESSASESSASESSASESSASESSASESSASESSASESSASESSASESSASESSASESSASESSASESSASESSASSSASDSSDVGPKPNWEWIIGVIIFAIAIILLIKYVIHHIFTEI